jgi:hypothetical protein
MWRSYVLYPFIHIGSLLIVSSSIPVFHDIYHGPVGQGIPHNDDWLLQFVNAATFSNKQKGTPQVVSDDSCIELGGWS